MLRDTLITDDRVTTSVTSDREPEGRPSATPDTTATPRESTPAPETAPGSTGTPLEKSAPPETGAPSGFQPRVDAEEGDPTRGDYVIGALVVLVILLGLLWAFGVIDFG